MYHGSDSALLVWIVIAAIAIGLLLNRLIQKVREWTRGRLKQTSTPTSFPAPTPASTSTSTSAPAPDRITIFSPNTPERLKDRMREKKAAYEKLDAAIPGVAIEFREDATTDQIIEAATQVGYPPIEVVSFMGTHGYSAEEIASSLTEWINDLDAKQLATLITQFVDGDTATTRVEKIFVIVKDNLFPNSNDDDDLLELPQQLGLPIEETAVILYHNTDLRLGPILTKLALYATPDAVGRIVHEIELDFTDDSNEYSALREEDEADFPKVVAILKACGNDVEKIASAENEYQEFSEDDIEDVFAALSNAGFTDTEIMFGLRNANVLGNNGDATLVKTAYARSVPVNEIAAFLDCEDVDPNDLDSEMRDLEMEIGTRVDVLYALLHLPKQKMEETPTTTEQ